MGEGATRFKRLVKWIIRPLLAKLYEVECGIEIKGSTSELWFRKHFRYV
jgi:hypothetical protein